MATPEVNAPLSVWQQETAQRYLGVRMQTELLCAPLTVEDHGVQPRPETSPPKWHLGHTSWFFETMVLVPHLVGYQPFDSRMSKVFNSYYEQLGVRWDRNRRGQLSRPSLDEVQRYREHVDRAMARLIASPNLPDCAALIELGLQHEQQHQELLVTDIKAILGDQPWMPAYADSSFTGLNLPLEHAPARVGEEDWWVHAGGMEFVGHDGVGFGFDNECPRHAVMVAPVALRKGLVSNREYLAFMEDGGYRQPGWWAAEGWAWVQSQHIHAPDHWHQEIAGSPWKHFTLQGLQTLDLDAPVTHVSWFEAQAWCQWAGWRLPFEHEWEALQSRLPWGARWEWTGSAYTPYPGFKPLQGAASEYNGKFMVNQMVLKGASFATPAGHARASYRNFFHPHERWQYTGIRPAKDM